MNNETTQPMKLYTSYFGKAKELNANGIAVISIALIKPRYVRCESLREVAPTREILQLKENPAAYTKRYEAEVLKSLDVEKLLSKIKEITNGRDAALCCYEKTGRFCHRHLLASYLREHGLNIEEYGTHAHVAGRQEATQYELIPPKL